MATNNKFLQILRNFAGKNRADAISKLQAVANGDLYHEGTPVVAFYGVQGESQYDSFTFPVRANGGDYGTDVTRNYKALLGVMGKDKGAIEIFDIQSSVEALIGGATDNITLRSVDNTDNPTWNFRSLGGIQVVIEAMDGFITTSLTNLNDRIDDLLTIMGQTGGQDGDDYTPPANSHYLGNALNMTNADSILDAQLYALSQTVGVNNVSNADGSITVDKVTDPTKTDINVHIKTDEAVIAKDANGGGLYTDIKVKKVIQNGTASDTVIVDPTLGTNIMEAYRFIATDGTQLGQQINIYKDSSLKEVYLGASTDTIDASTGDITKNTVTDPQSMNFAYQLADGTYSLTKIDVSKFLTESEFGDGLSVSNAGVVSVNAGNGLDFDDSTPNKKLIVKIDDSADENNYLTVGSDGVKLNGDAIDRAIAAGGATLTEVAARTETTADGTDFIKVVGTPQEDGHTNYAVSTQGIKDYVTTQLNNTSISAAGDNTYIAAAVDGTNNKKINVTGTYGVFNTPTAGNNSLSATTNGIAKAEDVATAVNTVVGNLDGSATATAASGNVYTVLTSVTETDGVIAKGGEVTLAAVAKTGAAADVSYANTTSHMAATTVQGAIDELKADALEAKTVVVGEAQAPDPTADPAVQAGNGVYVTDSTDQTDGHKIYTVAIDVFDCGTY